MSEMEPELPVEDVEVTPDDQLVDQPEQDGPQDDPSLGDDVPEVDDEDDPDIDDDPDAPDEGDDEEV